MDSMENIGDLIIDSMEKIGDLIRFLPTLMHMEMEISVCSIFIVIFSVFVVIIFSEFTMLQFLVYNVFVDPCL